MTIIARHSYSAGASDPKARALQEALAENERLTKQIRDMKPVVQAAYEVWRTRAKAEMSGSLEDAASLSEAEGVLFDALAALKELDDA